MKIQRRKFLAGLGAASLSLPFLPYMQRIAGAAPSTSPIRLIVFFHEAGTLVDEWKPGAGFNLTGAVPASEALLGPLEPFKDKLVVLSGLATPTAELPTNLSGHGRSKVGLLTGEGVVGGAMEGWSNGPSVEQVYAERLGPVTPKRSVDVQIGETQVTTDTIISFSAADQPVTSREADPKALYDTLFSGLSSPTDPNAQNKLQRDLAVLGAAQENFQTFRERLGGSDRQRLDAHSGYLKDIEDRLKTNGSGGAGCQKPTLPGSVDLGNHDTTGKLFADLVTMALACDLTRVATIAFNTTSNYQFPWTGVSIPYAGTTYGNWHDYIHDPVENQPLSDRQVKRAILRWHMEQLAYLLNALDSIPEGNGTLLDNTLVLSLSDHGDAAYHYTWDLPVILAGGAGGALKTGRHLDVPGTSNNDLLVSILNILGYDDKTFGRSEYCSGGVPGLL